MSSFNSRKTEFEQIFLAIRPRLRRMVQRYLRQQQDVDDIVQDTFANSYPAWMNQQVEKPGHYLMRTARNLSLKKIDSASRRKAESLDEFYIEHCPDSGDPVVAEMEAAERIALLLEATRRLPERCRRVFVLRKVHGLSHEEIASQLGITVSTSNQHLAKALAKVTDYLREQDYFEEPESRDTRTPVQGPHSSR